MVQLASFGVKVRVTYNSLVGFTTLWGGEWWHASKTVWGGIQKQHGIGRPWAHFQLNFSGTKIGNITIAETMGHLEALGHLLGLGPRGKKKRRKCCVYLSVRYKKANIFELKQCGRLWSCWAKMVNNRLLVVPGRNVP